jgi:hypothetical protein
MAYILIFLLSINPFYEANFSSLPMRSISVFSNPGGLGVQPGAELFFTYHPDVITTGISLGLAGAGIKKIDTLYYYEAGAGINLPGAFSLGYTHQFGDTSSHIFGLIGHVSPQLSIGYKTTLGNIYHMFGGISIRTQKANLTISGDIEYEGVRDIFNYYYGLMYRPIEGLKLNFLADQDFNWHGGLELAFGKIKIAGAYSKSDKKLTGGILFSAQTYETILPEPEPEEMW